MANNAANVSTGKPKAAGAIYTAPEGTELPKDAKTPLTEEFKSLGYVSEDGLTNAIETDSEKIKAWGGDTVLTVATSRDETFTHTFIETNALVMKEVYGDENVTGTDSDALVVVHKSVDRKPRVYVYEIALTGGRIKRIVVPRAQVQEVGEVTYVDGEAVGYEVTISAMPDAEGVTATEYIGKAA